jgi:hypothetical protein
MSSQAHHWIGLTPDPDMYYGFLYIITNNITGKKYIGRKFYHTYRKRKKLKESNWRKYTGSCKPLNEDIKTLGKENFTFEIFKQYLTRGNVVYYECNYQHKFDVLTARDEEGERLWYNGNIGAIKFIPVQEQSPETIAKRVAKLTGQKRTDEFKQHMSDVMQGNNNGATPCTEETKVKISKANTGKKRTQAQRTAMSKARIGKTKPLLRGARHKAIENGDKFYISRPCKNGHNGKRYTANGRCVECERKSYTERKKK